jgi:hypothetical protein
VSDELELSPNSKYISEIYTDESDLEMLKMDLFIVADTVDEWLEENKPIDPDICRYMGMLFLSLANRLESKRK